ncbi:MAG: ArnT family glycosyltransferase [Isosphaeraceae bacterium]
MRWSVLILVLLMAVDVWYRAHTFGPDVKAATGVNLWPMTVGESEPLDCDEAAYAYMGHRILQGDVMYRDLTENKPPLGYWLYSLGVAVGGYRELAIRLMAIPFVLATIAVVWWIGKRLGGPGAACLAGGLYILLSTDPFLFGNGSNMEHFINLFAALSLGLLIAGWDRSSRWWIFGAGVCLGAAALVKQVAIVHAVVFVPALLLRAWSPDPDRPRRRLDGLVDGLVLGLGIASIAAVAGTIVLAQGAGGPAFEDIVRYGGALATDTLPDPNAPSGLFRWLTGNADPRGQLPWPFGKTDYLVWWGSGSWPLWLASVPALAYLMLGKGTDARRRLAAGWTIAAWVQVVLPGLYWQHYYLLPIPGVAIAVAVSLADGASHLVRVIGSRERVRPARPILAACSTITLLAAIGGTLDIQARDYLGVAPEQLTIRYKGGRQWVIQRAMGRDLAHQAISWDQPHLYVWGWQAPLNFYGRMDSPTRHFFVDNLLRDQADRGHPLIAPRTDEIMATLRRHPPELIFAGYAPFKALHAFLDEAYRLSTRVMHDQRTGVGLWIRRDAYGKFVDSSSPATVSHR